MSFNRENVAWESQDGTWNVGYYTFQETCETDEEGFDVEWDVEYDWTSFWHVTTGQRSADEAHAKMSGNMGRGEDIHYKGNSALCKKYDAMAFACNHPEEAKKLAEKKQRAEFRKAQAAIVARITEDPAFWGKKLIVKFSQKSTPYELRLGAYKVLTGRSGRVGDWRVVDGARVFNEKTQKLAPLVRSIEVAERTKFGPSGYRW